ncbi:MAG: MerR family transcriptional regulator [Bacteroidota bacterium]
MESYSINDVQQLTGIKAHTLRIWEKRYNGLQPHRTTTNIRYYDDDQLRKLLNIATLIDHGHKISNVLDLPDDKINELIVGVHAGSSKEGVYQAYINTMVNAMLAFDEAAFDKVFSSIFVRFGVCDAVINVVYPFLHKTGVLWSTTNVLPVQEHFASNIIKRKLITAIDGLPHPTGTAKRFLLYLPSGELHEIGLLFADYLIRSAGHETIYLGQDVPFSNLQSAIMRTNPGFLLTFFIPGARTAVYSEQIEKLAATYPGLKIVVCARQFESAGPHTNILHLSHPDNILKLL